MFFRLLLRFLNHKEDPKPAPAARSLQEQCPMKIPNELVNKILAHLPPESATAFSLTCHAFHAQFFQKDLVSSVPVSIRNSPFGFPRRGLSPADQANLQSRQQLLIWLEKDTPSLYYCHICVRVHKWREQSKHWCMWYQAGLERLCLNENYVLIDRWPEFPREIGYPTARLFMNDYVYGPGRSPWTGPRGLARTIRYPNSFAGAHCTIVRARVLNGELLLYTVTSLTCRTRLFSDTFITFLESIARTPICSHCGDIDKTFCEYSSAGQRRHRMHQMTRTSIVDARRTHLLVGPSSPTPKSYAGSCGVCHTDFVYTVKSIGTPEHPRWSATLRKWHFLGDCRSPYEGKWGLVSGTASQSTPQRHQSNPSSGLPGYVKSAWGVVARPNEHYVPRYLVL